MGDILFGGTQDDHMTLAAVYRREQRRTDRGRNSTPSRRRSSSTPPAAKPFVEYMTRIPHRHPPNYRPLYIHKCLQDSHWGFCNSERAPKYRMWATCMAGCSGRPNRGAEIAADFLPQTRSLMSPRERWLINSFPERYGSDEDLWSKLYEK
jgi:hypothetical protein